MTIYNAISSKFSITSIPFLGCLLFFGLLNSAFGQETQRVNSQQARGNTINDVKIVLMKDSIKSLANEQELEDFYAAFFIKPGAIFDPLITDLAISRISKRNNVDSVYYQLYESASGSGTASRAIKIIIYVQLLAQNKEKQDGKGKFFVKQIGGIPILYESKRAQLKFFVNGSFGLYNDENALFGKGNQFASQNPVANDPAGNGTRFWAESSLEAGISAISQIKNSRFYVYGEASMLASGRNTSDIYSKGATLFADVERLNGGILVTGLGKKKNITINANYGRNFFQLNDGFLFASTSGSSNAGPRGSVYSSARTAFQKNGNLSLHWNKLRVSAHFLEPQELFKAKQQNTNYTIGTINYTHHKNLDVGVSYIFTTGGTAKYVTPNGTIAKKGMSVINPKLWLFNIAKTGLFFKSEAAYQMHQTENIKSFAWYTGLGYNFTTLKTTPSLYYRFAYLQGDNPSTAAYERFDPILNGRLGNWVQGLNFRKVVGNGNIVSHRIEMKSWISKTMAISLDYYYLQSDQLNNLGGNPPITTLKNKELGHEASLILTGLIKEHFTILGIVSYATPGRGIKEAFIQETPDWLSVQAALFINF